MGEQREYRPETKSGGYIPRQNPLSFSMNNPLAWNTNLPIWRYFSNQQTSFNILMYFSKAWSWFWPWALLTSCNKPCVYGTVLFQLGQHVPCQEGSPHLAEKILHFLTFYKKEGPTLNLTADQSVWALLLSFFWWLTQLCDVLSLCSSKHN